MGKRAVLIASLGLLGAGFWLLSRGREPSTETPIPVASESPTHESIESPIAASSPSDPAYDRTAISAPVFVGPELVLPVIISTRTALLGNGAPVPNVSVAVGVGALSDSESPVLAETRTDDQGRGEVSIPWSAVEAVRGKPDGRLWARVVSEGFQERTWHALLPATPTSTKIEVLAMSGFTVRGRLIDSENRGVAGIVRAVVPQTSTTIPTWLVNASADGSFELHLKQEGILDLLAETEEAGTAAILGKEIRLATASEIVELRVQGPGIVRGHVRDSSGKPAAGLPILVFLAVLDDDLGSFVSRDPEASVVAREGRGRSWATTRTAADGSFEARGLRADRYLVRARTGTQEPYPHLLTPTPIQSHGEDLALVLERPHLVVRVIDDRGEAFPIPATTAVSPWANEDSTPDPPNSWPIDCAVLATPVASEAHLGGLSRTYLPMRRSGEQFIFEVEENRRYQVGLAGGPQIWRPTEVPVPPGAGRIEVTLTARVDATMGEISVSAFDPEQSPVLRNVEIVLEDPITRIPLVRRVSSYEKPSPQRFWVPEGEYRVVVDGAPFVDGWHGILWGPRTSGRFETLVRVPPKQVVDVVAHLPQGAKLHLVLGGEVLEADREAIRKGFAGMTYELEYWANRAELTLVPPEGRPQPAMFTMVMTGSSAAGTHLTSALPLGSDSTSQILPAGRFRLEARMPGGRVVSKEIVLVDGETTDVTLEFDP